MKKFLSTILAVVMVLGSMAMVVSAEDTNIPTANGIWANGVQYPSIDSASADLSATGGTIYVHGVVEVGSRQTIAYSGITLEGVTDDAALIASTDFKNSSETNRKAVLTVTATGTTNIKNIMIDGTNYDNELESASTYDFKVVRVNAGTTNLSNVTINGSKRGLLHIGTSTSEATVNANGLYANAVGKSLSDATTYADVHVVNGNFNMTAGKVNAFIVEDKDVKLGNLDVDVEGHFTFSTSGLSYTIDVATTPEHIADCYDIITLNWLTYSNYARLFTSNHEVTKQMMDYVYDHASQMTTVQTKLGQMLDELIGLDTFNLYENKLVEYKTILFNGLSE